MNISTIGYFLGIELCVFIFTLDALQIHVLEFSRDRKMMSVLCSRNQMHILFSKGAPESIISRCSTILCNSDGSIVPLTADIRAELDSRFNRLIFIVYNFICICTFHIFFSRFLLSFCFLFKISKNIRKIQTMTDCLARA